MIFQGISIPQPSEQERAGVLDELQKLDGRGELGDLSGLLAACAAMRGAALPESFKSAMLLMCGDHGIARYGVSAFPQEVTVQMIRSYVRGTAGANVMCRQAETDIVVADIGVAADLSSLPSVHGLKVAWGTNDFTQGPAMSREQALAGIEAGSRLAEECIAQGYNLLATGEMGIGNTTSTAAIAAAYFGLPVECTVGRGSGINDKRMAVKRRVVTDGLAKNRPDPQDALDILAKVGGYDHAGIVGMILGAARHRVPVVIDGVNATAAALLAYGICPGTADYMLCSHLSVEAAHDRMLATLGLTPILDAGMHLGEGTGACLVIALLRSALGLYHRLKV